VQGSVEVWFQSNEWGQRYSPIRLIIIIWYFLIHT
jgi:hypothetical protein